MEDRYEQRLREVIEAKLKGEGESVEPEEPEGESNVIDLMAALKKSLGQASTPERKAPARKPAAKKPAAKSAATRRPGPEARPQARLTGARQQTCCCRIVDPQWQNPATRWPPRLALRSAISRR